MTKLVIDIGNTATKVAVFDGDKIISNEQHLEVSPSFLTSLLTRHNISKAILSSVKKEHEDWLKPLTEKVEVLMYNRHMALNIKNQYLTPNTLGLDRLAAVSGAKYLYPDKDTLVIDAGTCITYDTVDVEGNYYGGSISPGLKMRYKALNSFTSGLPLIEPDSAFNNTYGADTTTAIRSGVQNGIKYEVEGFIQQYNKDTQSPNIILTGGDSVFLDTLLKNSIFAGYIKTEPYLVLKGLNAAIQEHND
jgi:type III pantothenate kinase